MNFIIKIYDQLHIFLAKTKGLLRDFFGFLFTKIYVIAILLVNMLTWYFAYHMYGRSSQDIVILHYNVDFGINLIGNKSNFFIIPLSGLCFIILNIVVLLLLIKKKDFKFWAYFLLSFLSLLSIFLVLALLAMYIINF